MRALRNTRRPDPDEAAVSDVIGSVLLVGITVLMAAAFGAVLLSYDGPDDVQHTQLALRVGPGADGDWGTNDAELTLRHIGGEPLEEGQVRVTYVDASGSHTVSPSFTGDVLKLGDEWTQVVSATAGQEVTVQVVVREQGRSSLLSSGGVTAGGSGSVLTYVDAVSFASGSIDPTPGLEFVNAKAELDNLNTVLREGSVGGTPIATTVAATTATTSGGSNTNVKLSDDVRSALDNSGEWVQGSGFSPPTGVSVSALSIGMEARAVQNVETVAHVSTVTGSSSSSTTVSTLNTIPIASGYVYLAAIANGNTGLRTVSSVAGPCLVTPCSTSAGLTWTLVGTQTNSAGTGELEVWKATGTPTLVGFITATFSGATDRAAIAVSRYSGADTSNPIENSLAGEASSNTDTVSLGPVAGTATNGAFYSAINGITSSGGNPCRITTPANERAEVTTSGNRALLCINGGTAAASNTVTGTITGTVDWQGIALTIRPYSPALPTVSLSYSGCTGCTTSTTLTQALTTTDADYTVSIVGDKGTWALSDLSSLNVRVTYTTDTGADVEVDRVYLTLSYVNTPTTYNTQADLSFTGVPNLDNHVFQFRYKVSGDTFRVYAMTGAVERPCPGSLSSGTFDVFTCTLQGSEYNSGAPVLRIKDQTTGGTTQGLITIDYARVSSS